MYQPRLRLHSATGDRLSGEGLVEVLAPLIAPLPTVDKVGRLWIGANGGLTATPLDAPRRVGGPKVIRSATLQEAPARYGRLRR